MSQHQEAISTLFRSLNAYDSDTLKPLFAEDAILTQPQRAAYHGTAGVETMVNDLARQYTSWAAEALKTVESENAAAVEWTSTVTDFGGGQSRVDGCTLIDFRDGRIARLRSFWRPEDLHS